MVIRDGAFIALLTRLIGILLFGSFCACLMLRCVIFQEKDSNAILDVELNEIERLLMIRDILLRAGIKKIMLDEIEQIRVGVMRIRKKEFEDELELSERVSLKSYGELGSHSDLVN